MLTPSLLFSLVRWGHALRPSLSPASLSLSRYRYHFFVQVKVRQCAYPSDRSRLKGSYRKEVSEEYWECRESAGGVGQVSGALEGCGMRGGDGRGELFVKSVFLLLAREHAGERERMDVRWKEQRMA